MVAGLSLCLVLGGSAGEVVFAGLAAAFPVVLIGVGGLEAGRPARGLLAVLAIVAVQLVGSVVVLLALRNGVDASAGWPLAGSVLLVGLWLSPLLVVGLGYALVFDSTTLPEEQLAELRRAIKRESEVGGES